MKGKPIRCIRKFSEDQWHIIENAVNKGGATIAGIPFFKRTARRKVTIPDGKNCFLVMLFFRVEDLFANLPHKVLNPLTLHVVASHLALNGERISLEDEAAAKQ